MFFAPTRPRLKLLSAVSANLVSGTLATIVVSLNKPISLLMGIGGIILFTSIALQAEKALDPPTS